MRALGVGRVSTPEQATDAHFSLRHQKQVITEYCTSHHHELTDTLLYVKSGGRNAKELNQILSRVKLDHIEVVVVAELDRLARDMVSTLLFLEDLHREGCRFISIKDGLDMTDPMGEMRMMLLAMFAHYFRQQLSGKVRGGQQERFAAGKAHGQRPFGYRMGPDGHWVTDPVEGPVVQQIFAWYLQDWGVRRIAKHLNEIGVPRLDGVVGRWDARAIGNMISRPVYIGDLIYQRWHEERGRDGVAHQTETIPQVKHNTHPALVSREDWQAAQDRRATKAHLGPSSQPSPYLFSGLVRCGNCGGAMSIYHSTGYVCRAYAVMGQCSRATVVLRPVLEQAVLDALRTELAMVQEAQECTEVLWNRWAGSTPVGDEWHLQNIRWTRAREEAQTIQERARAAYLAGAFSLEEYAAAKAQAEDLVDANPPVPPDALKLVRETVVHAVEVVEEALMQSDDKDAMARYRFQVQRWVRQIVCTADKQVAVSLGSPPPAPDAWIELAAACDPS